MSCSETKNTGGGLYIGIRHGLCESVLSEYGKNAEFVTVRMNCKGQGLRFILVYGPQEKELEENRTEFYETLSIEIEKCFLSGDSLVLSGDFNAKLGNDIIKDDIDVMSPNGKLLHALMMKYNLSLSRQFLRVKNQASLQACLLKFLRNCRTM